MCFEKEILKAPAAGCPHVQKDELAVKETSLAVQKAFSGS